MNRSSGLFDALDEVLAKEPVKRLASSSRSLSARYRETSATSVGPPVQTSLDAHAYAAVRMPATYAAVRAVLLEIQARHPSWAPHRLLDAGAGPGTALWAAYDVWPSVREALMIERNGDMVSLGKELARRASAQAIRTARWSQSTYPTDLNGNQFDLVVAAYSVGEIGSNSREDLVAWLWSVTRDTLVLVEPGTPRGFSLVRAARAWLISHAGHMVAPCPHVDSCPMSGDNWCHFSQRLLRSSAHRAAKQVTRGFEDEKYSYIAMSRRDCQPASGRVIRHPQTRPGHVYLEICGPGGLERRIVTRKNKSAFREARDLRWGSPLTEKSPS